MKIAIVCPSLSQISGVSIHARELSRRLVTLGYEVVIYTTGSANGERTENGVAIREFSAFAPNETYFLSPKLFSALRKDNSDIIHCIGFNNLVTISALLAKKKQQKLIITLNSSGQAGMLRKSLFRVYVVAFNLFSGRIDRVICVSEFEKEYGTHLLRVSQDLFTVIPNGVDTDLIDKVRAKRSNQIITIGRLIENKGFHHVIHAFSILNKEMPSITLKIVGVGPFELQLRQLVTSLGLDKNVEFVGSIPPAKRKEFLNTLKQSKLFIFLSNYESQGMVVSEALAAGVPTIVANNSAMKEVVTRGYASGVDDVTNYPEIADMMKKMLSGKVKTKKPVILNWTQMVDRVVDVYTDVYRKKCCERYRTND